jgi:hypothetical protein
MRLSKANRNAWLAAWVLISTSCATAGEQDRADGTLDTDSTLELQRAAEALGFTLPPHWAASLTGVGAGTDPLNLIVAGDSDYGVEQLLIEFADSWSQVQAGVLISDKPTHCLSAMRANVNGSHEFQTFAARPHGCELLKEQKQPGGPEHNHLRAWLQTKTRAWFIAASEEHSCNGAEPCIDSDGFNKGRDDLVSTIVDSARRKSFQVVNGACPPAPAAPGCLSLNKTQAPAGTGSNDVSYDGLVRVLTVKLAAPGAAPAQQTTATNPASPPLASRPPAALPPPVPPAPIVPQSGPPVQPTLDPTAGAGVNTTNQAAGMPTACGSACAVPVDDSSSSYGDSVSSPSLGNDSDPIAPYDDGSQLEPSYEADDGPYPYPAYDDSGSLYDPYADSEAETNYDDTGSSYDTYPPYDEETRYGDSGSSYDPIL